MALTDEQAIAQAKELLSFRQAESENLNEIYAYLRGKQPLPIVPAGVPIEIRRLAKMARANFIKLIIDVPAESLYVSGFRTPTGVTNEPGWDIWQANRMDARQTAIHRAALAYGVSYARVTPGDPVPVIKGVSPRNMTTIYGDDESWPVSALERVKDRKAIRYRLYDTEQVYFLVEDTSGLQVYDTRAHDLGVVPVIRFRNLEDLDDDQIGEVEPLMSTVDQIDVTTFELLVAQHFQSFRQRYIMGWTAKSEEDKIKTGASRYLTFEDKEVKVGEFGEVNLGGYLDSRSASIENLATISQTPPHHLLGKLVNMSAEALVAADSGKQSKIRERQITVGESWEQTLGTAARAAGQAVSDGAQVRWADTEARSLAQTVDALGKIATMLGVPAEELWERIPGVTQQDVERWKSVRKTEPIQPQVTNNAPTPVNA